jgi:hypothetical protein
MKIITLILVLITAVLISSCGNTFKPPVFLAPDCIAAPITYDGTTYYVGVCSKGKKIVQYLAEDGENYRAVWEKGELTPDYYREVDNKWVEIGAKEADPPSVPSQVTENH